MEREGKAAKVTTHHIRCIHTYMIFIIHDAHSGKNKTRLERIGGGILGSGDILIYIFT